MYYICVMKAIINSQYIIEDIENFTLSLSNVFLGFKSEEAKQNALKQLKSLKFDDYSRLDIQFPSSSGLNSITIFEDYDG